MSGETVGSRVAVALLQLPHDAPLTRAMGIHGFTIPADYGSIEHLLLTLRMPPFDRGPAFTLSDIWARYALSVVLGALGALLPVLHEVQDALGCIPAEVVGEIADHVVVMRNGEIREQGPAKAVFENDTTDSLRTGSTNQEWP